MHRKDLDPNIEREIVEFSQIVKTWNNHELFYSGKINLESNETELEEINDEIRAQVFKAKEKEDQGQFENKSVSQKIEEKVWEESYVDFIVENQLWIDPKIFDCSENDEFRVPYEKQLLSFKQSYFARQANSSS